MTDMSESKVFLYTKTISTRGREDKGVLCHVFWNLELK